MGISDRRERERSDLRKRILTAARRIVFKEGTAALTMRRIAEAIEYAPATLYQYFENREAIVVELCLAGYRDLASALHPATAIVDPRERIEALGRAYVRFGMTHPETYRLVFMEDPDITTALYAQGPIEGPDGAAARTFAEIARAFAQLETAGLLAPGDDSACLADSFWAAVHGVVSLKLSCPHFPATPAETLAETTLRTFFSGALKRA